MYGLQCIPYQLAEQNTRFTWQMANADVYFIESVSQSVNKILLNMIISVRRSNELFKLLFVLCCSINVRRRRRRIEEDVVGRAKKLYEKKSIRRC